MLVVRYCVACVLCVGVCVFPWCVCGVVLGWSTVVSHHVCAFCVCGCVCGYGTCGLSCWLCFGCACCMCCVLVVCVLFSLCVCILCLHLCYSLFVYVLLQRVVFVSVVVVCCLCMRVCIRVVDA